jgi:Cdc6-like AAA superfamily ATPase
MANSIPQSEMDWTHLAFMLGTVFRPSTPVTVSELFAGRTTQILKVCDAINQSGRHAILYGEPGVGKTSCANMIFPNLYATGNTLLIPQVNCMGSDTFGTIWKRVFEEIKLKIDDTKELLLPQIAEKIISDYSTPFADTITPEIVRRLLHELAKEFLVVIVLDEFDTIEDPDARQAIAHFIKFLSDRNVAATIVLIGVADNVEQLIEDHRSIERCMSQIPIPRMTRDELELVVTKGLGQYKMKIAPAALHEISRIARGLPPYAHLFGLHAGRSAIRRKNMTVEPQDMQTAVETSLEDVQASTKSDYVKATTSARDDALFKEVLLATSMLEPDEMGFFYPKDVRPCFSRVRGKDCKIATFIKHLHLFCDLKRGAVLHKDEPSSRFRFTNPLLQPYVVMRGLAEKSISADDLKETRDPKDPQGRLF